MNSHKLLSNFALNFINLCHCTKDKLDKDGILVYMNNCKLWFGIDEFVVTGQWWGGAG